MKIGIAIEETWDFLHSVYADLCRYHDVSIFKRRTTNWPIFQDRRNRALFQGDLGRFMRQNDVVFFEWASELLIAATQMPKTCGIVTRLHRYEMYKWVDQVDWDKVDKIILVSKAKQAEFTKRFPTCSKKTVVIPASVSFEKFSFHVKPYSGDIGILCHLTPRKRVYELILDFYELTKRKDNLCLHIGGDFHPSHGDYAEAIRHLVQELALEDHIRFYGLVKDTPMWYQNIDIFISNSYSEGLQVALMEAMASGCYCLSHRWAGVEDLLPSDNLFYTGSELQDCILRYSKKTDEERLLQKKQMHEIAIGKCSTGKVNVQIRQVIEELNRSK